MSLSVATDDLARRMPVWEALSELFLDTDVMALAQGRAHILAASPYSSSELQQILQDEVHPVCKHNLRVLAGEWSGFDREWLQQRILRHLGSPWRWLERFDPDHWHVVEWKEWRETLQHVEALRRVAATPSSPDPSF